MYSKYILVLKFPENLCFLESVPEKIFLQKDAGSLKLTISFSVGGFKVNC